MQVQLEALEACHVRAYSPSAHPFATKTRSPLIDADVDAYGIDIYAGNGTVRQMLNAACATTPASQKGSQRVTWSVGPSTSAPRREQFAAELPALGFTEKRSNLLVLEELQSVQQPGFVSNEAVARVEEVSQDEGVKLSVENIAVAFGIAPPTSQFVVNMAKGMMALAYGPGTGFRCFSVYNEDRTEAIATVLLILDFDAKVGWLHSISVLEAHRRQGLAAALCQRCILVCQESGMHSLGLKVSKSGASNLYSRFGFTSADTWMSYHGSWTMEREA
ncbi:hypothetical protein BC830DRAFT_1174151 [Chytriomyces sp. MP71]|nr:hypothetical protein BC830DRAFT_1174151 [Chytriomyces sp. MP71]